MYQRILVAIDLGDDFTESWRAARALGPDADIAMLHVLPEFVDLAPGKPPVHQSSLPAIEDLTLTTRATIRDWTDRATADDRLRICLERGPAVTKIVERAKTWKADLVVVGNHGVPGVARLLLGSVAEGVVHAAPCPVLVRRPKQGSGPVIVATDLSEISVRAIQHGAAEARRRSTGLIVMHVVDSTAAVYAASTGALFGATVALPPAELQQEIQSAMQETLRDALVSLGASGEPRVLYGNPSDVIVQFAREHAACLVVMGDRHRSTLARLALGSVADAVTRNAPCSVLVARPDET